LKFLANIYAASIFKLTHYAQFAYLYELVPLALYWCSNHIRRGNMTDENTGDKQTGGQGSSGGGSQAGTSEKESGDPGRTPGTAEGEDDETAGEPHSQKES
jgi:hypothetical protein